jgi:hypothetical protein
MLSVDSYISTFEQVPSFHETCCECNALLTSSIAVLLIATWWIHKLLKVGGDNADFLGKLKQATLLLGYGEDQYGQF